MVKVCDIFDVRYGVNLELNALRLDPKGINFVSRTAKNNGVAARVAKVVGINPLPAGTITVAGGGSVMESFLQPEPYYSGRDLYYLTPKMRMTDAQKLYYCAVLRANRYRFNYGRQANRTLKDILIPELEKAPKWVSDSQINRFYGKSVPARMQNPLPLKPTAWKLFLLGSLFDIKKGKRLTKLAQTLGDLPFIGSIDSNNGVSGHIGQKAIHKSGTITVNYNGSVAEAFYQPKPFWASDDVNVLYPKGFMLTPAIAMFLITVIRLEKYRFNYGRKWHLDRMRESEIRLPAKKDGSPDWGFMEDYIERLSFSSQIMR